MESSRFSQQGFETPLHDRGQKSSGDQRQRISIARACSGFAGVDFGRSTGRSTTNRAPRAAELSVLMQGGTTLVIAHRLSTVEGADRIIVLDEGRIVEMGNRSRAVVSRRLMPVCTECHFTSSSRAMSVQYLAQ